MGKKRMFLDPQRCIGCKACVAGCAECESHKGISMISIDMIEGAVSAQTFPTVCMHCEDPACVKVCPADAIKIDADGFVLQAMAESCLYCRNCVYGCPFGVPRYNHEAQIMVKCDGCYDRTSVGKRPMCATVCPTSALTFGEWDEVVPARGGEPVNEWVFGDQVVRTGVYTFLPRGHKSFRMGE